MQGKRKVGFRAVQRPGSRVSIRPAGQGTTPGTGLIHPPRATLRLPWSGTLHPHRHLGPSPLAGVVPDSGGRPVQRNHRHPQAAAHAGLKACIVTFNALACRTDIAETIAAAGGTSRPGDNRFDLHANQRRDFARTDCTTAVTHDHSETVERGTAAPHSVPARSWAVPTASGTSSIPTTAAASGTACTEYWPNTPGRTAAARSMAALQRIARNFLTILKQYFQPRMSIRQLPG